MLMTAPGNSRSIFLITGPDNGEKFLVGSSRIRTFAPLILCLLIDFCKICLKVNKDKGREAYELLKMLYAWKEQADKLSSEEINREEYDNWRYHYPEFDTTQRWAKVPSQELSDALVEAFKDHLKDK